MSEYFTGLAKARITFSIALGGGFKKLSGIPATSYFSTFQLPYINFPYAPWPPSLQTADRGSGEQQANTDVVFQCWYTALLCALCGWYLNPRLRSGGTRIPQTTAKTRGTTDEMRFLLPADRVGHLCMPSELEWLRQSICFFKRNLQPMRDLNRCMGWYEIRENVEWVRKLSGKTDCIVQHSQMLSEH